MNPSERLLSLYSMLLFSGREISLKELAQQMSCSKQTIMRDMEKLEASKFGKLLCEKQGRESVYRLARPARLPRLALDAEGLRQLALCRAFLLHLLPENMREHTEKTLQQASAYLSDGETSDNAEDVGQSFAKGSIDYTPFGHMLDTLITLIHECRVCEVCYRAAGRGEDRTYCFAPKKLIAYHETFYVRGWVVPDSGRVVQEYDQPTDLAVHRLVKVVPTRRVSGHLPDVDSDDEEAFGLMDGEPFRVRVHFTADSAVYAAERTWSKDQTIVRHRDGSLTLSMTCRSDAEVMAWVLGFGDTAELLSPRWLRNELAGRVKRMAESYGAGKSEEDGIRT